MGFPQKRHMKKSFMKYRWVYLTIVLVLISCAITLVTQLFSYHELSYETFAALIGVMITAIITQVLLNGQTENDAKRDKDSKVFEEKLRIYQDFLKSLCEVVSDNQITEKEKMELQFQTSYIAMHTSVAHIKAISEAVKKVVEATCPLPQENRGRGTLDSPLEPLFDIVRCFKEELYPDLTAAEQDPEELHQAQMDIIQTIENFKAAFSDRDFKDEEEHAKAIEVYLKDVPEGLLAGRGEERQGGIRIGRKEKKEEEDLTLLNEAIARWKQKGWTLDEKERLGCTLKLEDGITVGTFYKDGDLNIQACYDHPYGNNLAKALTQEFREGNRYYGHWWVELEEPYRDIAPADLRYELARDPGLQKCVIDWTDRIIAMIEPFHRLGQWYTALAPKDWKDWKISINQNKSLMCDSRIEGIGKPYLDAYYADGKARIALFTHPGDIILAARVANEIGAINTDDLTIDMLEDSGRYIIETIEDPTPEAVAGRLRHWMEKIDTLRGRTLTDD